MSGDVDDEGVPYVVVELFGQEWVAIIDTGFNGDLELPDRLGDNFAIDWIGQSRTTLGGGTVITEDLFELDFPFDGEIVRAEEAFAPVSEILIGTHFLRRHRLEIDFVQRTVRLEKVHIN